MKHNQNILQVIRKAWLGGFSTKSDFARTEATNVAIAACSGYITTEQYPGQFGSVWYVTPIGLAYLHDEDEEEASGLDDIFFMLDAAPGVH